MARMIAILTALAALAAASPARADSWECADGSTSACYVSYVRFYPRGNPYVRAKLHDPRETTGCDYVRVRVAEGTDDPDTVRAVEALLLTALTTGMAVRFFRLDRYGSETDCYASSVILSRPGS